MESPSATTLNWRKADPRGNNAEVKNTRFTDFYILQMTKFDFHRRSGFNPVNEFPSIMTCLASEKCLLVVKMAFFPNGGQ